MSFSSNLALWLGSAPNALQSGRVDCYVGANNDKTGYSLTAGSYALHGSNNQRSNITTNATSGTAAISAVTLARTRLAFLGHSAINTTADDYETRLTLTNTTTVTSAKTTGTNNVATDFEVEETF